MAEFKCPCGGTIGGLFNINDYRHGKDNHLHFYGCTRCHRLWWDAPEMPLSQEHIDRSWAIK